MSESLRPENLSEMMQALTQFKQIVSEATMELTAAGKDCADNLGEDPAGAKANASLSQKVGRINEQVGEAARIAMLLQEELEDIVNRSRKADDF